MRRFSSLVAASLGFLALFGGSAPAHADEDEPSSAQASPAPGPPSTRAANGEFVAPLAQRTQRTYVPQSVALSGPTSLGSWSEGDPVPDGYHKATRVRRGAIVGGGITFGTLYLLSIYAASEAADSARNATFMPTGSITRTGGNPDAALYIPAFGPFIQMGSTASATGNFFLAVDGVGQAVGLALIVYGITSPTTVLVRNDLAKAKLVPMKMGEDGYGLGVYARF